MVWVSVGAYLALLFWRLNKDHDRGRVRYSWAPLSEHVQNDIPNSSAFIDVGAVVHTHIPGKTLEQATFGRILYDGEGLRKALGIESWEAWRAANGYGSVTDVHAPTKCPEDT